MENKNVDISMVKFDEKGLVPAVVQEENGQVLMLAYMNEESSKDPRDGLHVVLQPQSPETLAEGRDERQRPESQGNLL